MFYDVLGCFYLYMHLQNYQRFDSVDVSMFHCFSYFVALFIFGYVNFYFQMLPVFDVVSFFDFAVASV